MKIFSVLFALTALSALSLCNNDIHAMVAEEQSEQHGEKEGQKEIDNSCSICLEEIEHGARATIQPCMHRFHVHCLGRVLASNHASACPNCRGTVNTATISSKSNESRYLDEKESRALENFLKDKHFYQHELDNAFREDRNPESAEETARAEAIASEQFRRFSRKLIPLEFVVALLNGFIARSTIFKESYFTDLTEVTLGCCGMILLFAGSHKLLRLINPQRQQHIGKVTMAWLAGLALGYNIANQLKRRANQAKENDTLKK